MSGTLALAATVAELSRADLERLFALRRLSAPAAVHDPISVAVDLLRDDSVAHALEPLECELLGALRGLAAEDGSAGARAALDELRRRGLVGTEDHRAVALPEVTRVLERMIAAAPLPPADRGEPDTRAEPPADPPAPAASDDWYAPALLTVTRTAAILRRLGEHPVALGRRGGVPVLALRALAEIAHCAQEEAERIVATLELAGMLARTAPAGSGRTGSLLVSPAASAWLALPHPERWAALALARVRATPAPLLAALDRRGLVLAAERGIGARFPLLSEGDRARARAHAAACADLGLTEADRLSSAGALAFGFAAEAAPARGGAGGAGSARGAGSPEAAGAEHDASSLAARFAELRDAAERAMPPAAPGVYVQPDLSIIVPGPLAPRDEHELFRACEVEQLGIACTLRVTAASIGRVLDTEAGITDVRSMLERVSLTGVPQPLDYLLTDVGARAGSVVVHEHHGDEGRARVEAARPDLLTALLVDRALQHLHLQPAPEGGAAYSRLRPDHVLAALVDARYPAVATGAAAQAAAPEPQEAPRDGAALEAVLGALDATAAAPSAPELSPAEREAVARVCEAARQAPGAGGVQRRLELAIRERSAVRVTAEARDRRHEFVLLPVSLKSGRLRASDQAAGVERTLPLSAIVAVEPA